MVRYHRMKGRPTLWLPGTDHAGIATQVCVCTNSFCSCVRVSTEFAFFVELLLYLFIFPPSFMNYFNCCQSFSNIE